MTNLDSPGPEDMAEIRSTLSDAGYDTEAMSDEQAVVTLRGLLAEQIPAPQVPAGPPPVPARVWLAEALTAGGYKEPEDRDQHAELDDGGPPVHLAVLGTLVMRHMSGARPSGWTDEGLADRIGLPRQDFTRAQRVLDEVAAEVGRPAKPEPGWWLTA